MQTPVPYPPYNGSAVNGPTPGGTTPGGTTPDGTTPGETTLLQDLTVTEGDSDTDRAFKIKTRAAVENQYAQASNNTVTVWIAAAKSITGAT